MMMRTIEKGSRRRRRRKVYEEGRFTACNRPSNKIDVPAGALTTFGSKAKPHVRSCPPASTWRFANATTSHVGQLAATVRNATDINQTKWITRNK